MAKREQVADYVNQRADSGVDTSYHDIAEHFEIEYSTARYHVAESIKAGLMVRATVANRRARSRPRHSPVATAAPTITTALHPSASAPATPPAPLPSTITSCGSESLAVLERLATTAIRSGDHQALAIVVDAIAAVPRGIRETAREQREPTPAVPDSRAASPVVSRGSEFEVNEENLPSVPSSPSLRVVRESPRENPIAGTETQQLRCPPTGSAELDAVVADATRGMTHRSDASATPVWLRPGVVIDPAVWTVDDRETLCSVWRAQTGTTMPESLVTLAQLWLPSVAVDAASMIGADDTRQNKAATFRVATALGYHKYYPPDVGGLEHYETWVKDRRQAPKTLDALKHHLELLAGLQGAANYPVRVAAAIAPHRTQLDEVVSWGLVALDAGELDALITRYDTPARTDRDSTAGDSTDSNSEGDRA